MTEKKQKKSRFQKLMGKDTQKTPFGDFWTLLGILPKTLKAKAKMALASLVSSQKQKHTIVKVFMKSDAKKAVFQRGE